MSKDETAIRTGIDAAYRMFKQLWLETHSLRRFSKQVQAELSAHPDPQDRFRAGFLGRLAELMDKHRLFANLDWLTFRRQVFSDHDHCATIEVLHQYYPGNLSRFLLLACLDQDPRDDDTEQACDMFDRIVSTISPRVLTVGEVDFLRKHAVNCQARHRDPLAPDCPHRYDLMRILHEANPERPLPSGWVELIIDDCLHRRNIAAFPPTLYGSLIEAARAQHRRSSQ